MTAGLMTERPANATQRRIHLAALQRERDALEERGLDDRVAQVDAEIERLGGRPPAEKAVRGRERETR